MKREELGKHVERGKCRVIGWRDAPTDGNRRVVGAVIGAFDNSDSAVLVEPSLSRKTSRPPDVVLIDPEVGVAVLEVKGVGLDQVETIEAGGVLAIRYRGKLRKRNAVAQVRTQMFDIKDATARVFDGELTIPFKYFVVFPAIHRAEWVARFGRDGFCPPEFLFAEDLERHALLRNLRATDREGAWPYESMKGVEPAARAVRYREHLGKLKARDAGKFDRVAFDAIYVDEGQDFVEAEFELLRDLCRTKEGGEPSLFVFYDDAQNLYGRSRPNWASLGLNLRGGRAYVMTECFRNPRAIVETSFNVLYGTAFDAGRTTPTREFADVAWLLEKGLIEMDEGRWRVRFAPRKGKPPMLTLASDAEREIKLVLARLIILIRDERVRPQDILIVTHLRDRARTIADAIRREKIAGVDEVAVAFEDKESTLCQPGRVTVSTVHSAKGYDAFVVLLCSANEFKTDVKGRACFYVACTRAVEHLEVFAYERRGLVVELGRLLEGGRLE